MARILIADDSVEQLTVQRKLFEALGYDVSTALSPEETLRALLEIPPGLIIVDLHLPEASDGLALIREIRRAGHRQPLIVLSGWPEDLYGAPEEKLISRILIKGSTRELLHTISVLLPA